MALFCPNCGTQNESSQKPCTQCGYKLSGVSTPKFKGTMMLNSEQSVQDLIDEHKKRLAAEESDESASGASPSRPPPSVPRPELAARGKPKKPMAGTMLGVAPQMGGIRPPAKTPPADPPPAPPAVAETELEPEGPNDEDGRRAEALAGTVEMSASQPPSERETARPPAAAARPLAGGTQPLEAVAPANPPAAPEGSRGMGTDTLESHVAGAHDVPAPSPTGVIREADDAPSIPKSGVSLLEAALIVATCGVYGIVLLVKHRKPR